MRARTLAFLPVLSLLLVSCAGIGGAIEDTSASVRGFVSNTGDKIGGLFNRDEEAKALKAAAITSDQAEADPAAVRTIQHLLADAGYTPGPADGILGQRTVSEIKLYQSFAGLSDDGTATVGLLEELREMVRGMSAAASPPPEAAKATAEPEDAAAAVVADADDDEDDKDIIEDASELGEDEDDVSEVVEGVEGGGGDDQ